MKIDRDLMRPNETLDSFYHGKILVFQKKRGFRFSVDAPLLADFITTRSRDEALELGTGCGIISLLLSLKPFKKIIALEVQESLAELARCNVMLNGLEDRIKIIRADLRTYNPGKKFDLIFSNPPYIKAGTGYLSPASEKAVAKHEVLCNLDDIVVKTAELLKKNGRACFIFPARRFKEFEERALKHDLKFRLIRFVHAREKATAVFFLAELGFESRERKIVRPLILFDLKGQYTREAKAIFAGRIKKQ